MKQYENRTPLYFFCPNSISIYFHKQDNTECQDTNNGATDVDGDDCEYYNEESPEDCGGYDDDDFTANTMCCVCKTICDRCQLSITTWNSFYIS